MLGDLGGQRRDRRRRGCEDHEGGGQGEGARHRQADGDHGDGHDAGDGDAGRRSGQQGGDGPGVATDNAGPEQLGAARLLLRAGVTYDEQHGHQPDGDVTDDAHLEYDDRAERRQARSRAAHD
ncbi:MAG: hypothetical protein H0T66_04750, partial [Geodermatophilaceae bacterium]|nr:hypothetical protein [Geodermatophilaceae bacterium]